MSDVDPKTYDTLAKAAQAFGLDIDEGDHDNFAMVKHSPNETIEYVLSGKPILFGWHPVDDKWEYYAIAFADRGDHDVALVLDKHGKVVAEHPAQLMVPRKPNSLFVGSIGSCWVKITIDDGCLKAIYRCGNYTGAWSTCDY